MLSRMRDGYLPLARSGTLASTLYSYENGKPEPASQPTHRQDGIEIYRDAGRHSDANPEEVAHPLRSRFW